MHWACEKIAASTAIPDIVLLESLLDKVCVSYSHTQYLMMLPVNTYAIAFSPCFSFPSYCSSGYVKAYHMLQWQLRQITVAGESWLPCSLTMSPNPRSRQVFFWLVSKVEIFFWGLVGNM
jgi:hypothetical protein